MSDNFSVLHRLFGRTDNAVISMLYSHCLGQPLLVEPERGERLLGAYMQGPVSEISQSAPKEAGKIAILNISGALTSRPMPGPSGPGPQNYEELGATVEELVVRDDVDAIVLRLDTPGGFAAGLFDFTDQLASWARNDKPIHAVVEHMAFSAGYAIAAACTEVWVTRTGGVGSVGAVMYHVDQSKWNKKKGLVVTPIFAGDRKIDYSPHFPISEQALNSAQAEIDKHYDLFVGSVARYRGMEASAVVATQAGLFMGQDGVDIGFADRVGTLKDALAHIAQQLTPGLESNRSQTMNDGTDKTETELEASDAAVVAADVDVRQMIFDSGLDSALQIALMKCDLSSDDAEQRIDHAREIASICSVAERDELALSFVEKNTSLDEVRRQVTDAKAAAQQDIDVTLPAQGSAGGNAVPTAWDKTIEKLGGKA